jgi:hypothetical protein
MNCEQQLSDLDPYLDAELDPRRTAEFEAHAAQCQDCGRRLAQARRLARALAADPVAGPSEEYTQRALTQARKRQRPPRIVAAGFVAAFSASIVTLIYTGLMVGAPNRDADEVLPVIAMSLAEPRTVNLVFAADMALDDVSLRVDLPRGIELLGYEGERQVRWSTHLQAGKNVLPLQLRATDALGGFLTARLRYEDEEKVFRINVSVSDG